MNSRTLDHNNKHNSFLSLFLGIDRLFGKKQNEEKTNNPHILIVNESGNISADYSNPEVIKNIKKLIKSFENIPLSEDVKVRVEPRATKK